MHTTLLPPPLSGDGCGQPTERESSLGWATGEVFHGSIEEDKELVFRLVALLLMTNLMEGAKPEEEEQHWLEGNAEIAMIPLS